ncbi:class B sortase [Parablautia sp. Marseille-Q6255]|uniref:class B sortase n=1 Tax=Parablautia sp. Marseille-Q6255 TaxID=3039593 RepID=UPI0024BD20FA|nr:class B sortase [Parablautia sp. Marseille-Q6255]
MNLLIVLCFLPILCYGIYVLWDSQHINQQADASLYETYRPSKESHLSFEELRKHNSEVFGWLTVEDTHIDYPLVQAENNSKYVNTDVLGEFSLSGSIFLDCRNQKNFLDFNHILYGHHMAKDAMFGELEYYEKLSYFKEHLQGSLYYGNSWHSIEFFAFLYADAYDNVLYNTFLQKENISDYLDYVKEHAINYVELPFREDERFITLSTCTSTSTNGRHLLIGRIMEDTINERRKPQYEEE